MKSMSLLHGCVILWKVLELYTLIYLHLLSAYLISIKFILKINLLKILRLRT